MAFSFGKVNVKELAQQCGRSRSFMGRVLSGEKGPSVDTLHRMSRYFNLSMDETLRGAQKDSPGSLCLARVTWTWPSRYISDLPRYSLLYFWPAR